MAVPLHLLLLASLPSIISAANVTHLPGFAGPLPFELETGYESVDDIEFFYYFVRSERNPSQDPLLFWFSGGPGCSSFTALATEIGPIRFIKARYDGQLPSLVYNPYCWTKFSNIVFVDSPTGTGFTFSISAKDYDVFESVLIEQICRFISKWYEHHPYFLPNPLYLGGDSYGGKLVPMFAHELATGYTISASHNLKGYLVGNPVTNDQIDVASHFDFANRMGIISDEFYKVIMENCEGEDYSHPNPQNIPCLRALSEFDLFYSEVNPSYILDPSLVICPIAFPRPEIMVENNRRSLKEEYTKLAHPPEAPDARCTSYTHYLAYYWMNDKRTREALHIKKGSIREWVRCNRTLSYTNNIDHSSLKYHFNLMKRGYRALIYSGDHDLLIPFVGTHAWIKSFNFSIVDDWRSWHVNGQVAGYTRKFENDVTFATVKNAGHTAPEWQSKNCMHMFERWISYKRL